MMYGKIFIISTLMLITPVAASELVVINNKSAVLEHFKNDIATLYGHEVDTETIVIINAELNNDKKKDYWVSYPSKQCTSEECFGHVYLKTSTGYCFAGKGMKETDLNFGRKTQLKCEPGGK